MLLSVGKANWDSENPSAQEIPLLKNPISFSWIVGKWKQQFRRLLNIWVVFKLKRIANCTDFILNTLSTLFLLIDSYLFSIALTEFHFCCTPLFQSGWSIFLCSLRPVFEDNGAEWSDIFLGTKIFILYYIKY